MHLRFLDTIKVVALALVLVVVPRAASAASFNIGTLLNGQSYVHGLVNIATDTEFQWDGFVNGAGSFSADTYVDPFFPTGYGSANILIGVGGGATSVTGSWGGNAILFSQIGNSWQADFSVAFTQAGIPGAQLLEINWVGATNDQFSLSVAVPGPVLGAGLPGLMLACGALIMLARRRRAAVV